MKLHVKTADGCHHSEIDFSSMDLEKLKLFAQVGAAEAKQELAKRLEKDSQDSKHAPEVNPE